MQCCCTAQSTAQKVLPEKNDIRKIKLRAGKKCGWPAKDGDSDSLDEGRKKPKRAAEKEKETCVRAVE